MLKRLSAREKFEQLIQQFEPAIRQAFIEAIDDIKSSIVLRRVVERLERNDFAGAVRAFNLDDPAVFRKLDKSIAEAYEGGGIAAVERMPTLRDPEGHILTIRFNMRNPPVEAYLREHSSNLIRGILENAKEAVRIVLEAGMRSGTNPTQTALQIAGRVSRVTGRREGGLLGLTSVQTQYSTTARDELASGDTALLRNYLTRGRRDKRFDGYLRDAIKHQKPVPAEVISKMISRYNDGLLKLRADTIGRTETAAAMGASKKEAYNQAIARGEIDVDLLTKVWRSPPKTKFAREQHQEMNGQEVKFQSPFVAPDGTLLDFPCAPGAPIKHTANCRCDYDVRVDYFRKLRGR